MSCKVKVVYLAGSERSGSTLLDRVLGEGLGCVSVGELCSAWSWGLEPGAQCGCGANFQECDFWGAVFERAFGGLDQLQGSPKGTPTLRPRDAVYTMLPWKPRSTREYLDAHGATLEALYAAIAHVSGRRTIVDSSKRLEYAYLLRGRQSLDVYVVHLVRDSRAVAFSLRRRGKTRAAVIGKAVRWTRIQLLAELLRVRGANYMRVRYEDFAHDPRVELSRIGRFIGVDLDALPFVDDRTIQLSREHGADGNPLRLQQGSTVIRLDDQWQTAMSFADRAAVAALTWPLLLRYGYLASAEYRGATPARLAGRASP